LKHRLFFIGVTQHNILRDFCISPNSNSQIHRVQESFFTQFFQYAIQISFCNKESLSIECHKKQSLSSLVFLFMGKTEQLTEEEKDRLVEMAWEDRTPFEAIRFQFGLTQGEVIKFMRATLKPSSFVLWRKRVNQGTSIKHLNKRSKEVKRFKCSRQRIISSNKISKR
jgi:uncharacterized protein (TIGR03643 family)